MIQTEPPAVRLPEDVQSLQQMVLDLLANIDDLKCQLALYKRHLFGRRSEKLDPAQRMLFEGLCSQLEARIAHAEAKEAPSRPNRGNGNRNGRRPLPADLPRERIDIHPQADQRVCQSCGRAKEVIGEEITEELEYVPASFVVQQYVRYKYACRHCGDGVCIGELPPRPIEKGRPGSGLLSHVLTSKYCDHLPLHRLEGIFKRHGVEINRSTMCDWVRDCAVLLRPIVEQMKRRVLESPKIHTDDTSVAVQCRKKRGKTYKGYLWAYIGTGNDVVFDFTPTRCRDGPIRFLGDYSGYVQADAYNGYDKLFEEKKATEVGCWAHARRKFYDSIDSDPVRGNQMLALIGKLYDVERDAKDQELETEAIKALRQTKSKPILEAQIKPLLDGWSIEVLPKSPMGKAVGYALGQWEALNRYLDDGLLSIDNNLAERVLRHVVIGRKNWLFAGNEAGAERAAVIYSLVSSCKLCGIDPFVYLRDVLDRVSTHPAGKIEQLTPANWPALQKSLTPDADPAV
jgi:transposase